MMEERMIEATQSVLRIRNFSSSSFEVARIVSSASVRAYELRTKSKAELAKDLEDLKTELASLRVKQHSSSSGNQQQQQQQSVPRITTVRKAIARVNTVISQVQRDQLRLFYKGAKYTPLDLRVKKTRAIRRRLTNFEKAQKTVKATKKERHFPQRKYAIKA
ncbi:60S ribosomal protein L35 [Chytriomyces hyalinus]|nr:60S ribosomal protein L35 [Chytriomyces hyalinus]